MDKYQELTVQTKKTRLVIQINEGIGFCGTKLQSLLFPFFIQIILFLFLWHDAKISFTTESVFPFFYNLMMPRHKYYATPRQILIALRRRPQTAIKDFRQKGPVALDCNSFQLVFCWMLSCLYFPSTKRQLYKNSWMVFFIFQDTNATLLSGLSDTRHVQY